MIKDIEKHVKVLLYFSLHLKHPSPKLCEMPHSGMIMSLPGQPGILGEWSSIHLHDSTHAEHRICYAQTQVKTCKKWFIMGICRPLSIMLLLYAFINPRFRDDSYDAWHWESVKQQSLNKNGLLN